MSKYAKNQMIDTGISQSSVKKVRAELSNKGMFSIPEKRYSKSWICVDADSFDSAAIRREIHKLQGKSYFDENSGLSYFGSII